MGLYFTFLASLVFSVSSHGSMTETISRTYKKSAPHIESLYKDFHRNPELSGIEFKTAKKMAQQLKNLGLEVTEKIGGTGVVGVLKNGNGPVLWLRADMDALPIQEETKKNYTSLNKGVMHACGHDTHMAAMIGYAQVLIALKDRWRGTLVFISQPAEELGAGARAMIQDGLFDKFPKPDFILGFHVSGVHKKGTIAYTPGYAFAAVDSIDIEVQGLGGHGALPEHTIDPVVLASKIVVNSQTLVSRNIDPRQPTVLTFGSVHGGTKHNIIPNKVHIQGTLRTYSEAIRKKMKEGLHRVSRGLAQAEGAPHPKITFSQSLPATFNHLKLTSRMVPLFQKVVGTKNVKKDLGIMGAEDFSLFSQKGKYPSLIFLVGGAPYNSKNFGPNHNSKFAPEYKSVLKVAVTAMSLAVTNLLPNTKLAKNSTH